MDIFFFCVQNERNISTVQLFLFTACHAIIQYQSMTPLQQCLVMGNEQKVERT